MKFFYFADSGTLTPLTSFEFREGATPVIRTPTLGGDVFRRGRPEPDTFRMDATGLGQMVGAFKVVDDKCMVYECIGTNVSGANGQIVVSGIVASRWEIEADNRAEALKMQREATGA